MPIYEYACNACGKNFEAFLGINDKPLKKCTYCKSSKIKKLISNCSFQLKGTGWYATDYAKKDSGTSKQEKKTDSSGNNSSSEVKASGTASESKASEAKTSEGKASENKATNKAA
ncbi:MAG: zinc ribbon domain-containing protein [Pseudomonadota bacterium]